MNQKGVIVLNFDHSFLNYVNWKRACRLVIKGKAVILEAADEILSNAEQTFLMEMPKVIKLVKYVKGVYRAKVTFTKANVILRDKRTCLYCGSKKHITVDHIIPVSEGGKSDWLNCCAACFSCNSKKSNKSLKESGLVLKYQPYQPTLSQFLAMKLNVSY